MKSLFFKKSRVILSVISLVLVSLMAGIIALNLELAAIPNQPVEAPTGRISIIIKIPSRVLEIHENNKLY